MSFPLRNFTSDFRLRDLREGERVMTSGFQFVSGVVFRKGRTMVLALAWLLGLVAGYELYLSMDSDISSLMRGVSHDSVSIVGLLLSVLLPFLCSAFAVFISLPGLLIPIGFGKACLLSFVSFGILLSYGSAGWLFRLLLMFSDIFTAPLLYWYMHRHLQPDSRFSMPESIAVLSVSILIGSIDSVYILPFLAGMINS